MNTLHIIAVTSGKLPAFRSRFAMSRQFRAFSVLVIAAVVGVLFAAQFDSVLAGVFGANATAVAITFHPILGVAHALDTIAFSATAPGAAGAAAAAIGTDSLVVKSGKGARIVNWWGDQQTAGFQQVINPSGHDTTRNYRTRSRADALDLLLPEGLSMPLAPQESLTVTIAGSATAGDVEIGVLALIYDSLPGTSQRLIAWVTLLKKMKRFTTIDMTLAGTATGYTGSTALNGAVDLLRSNTDYALIGATSDLNQTLIVSGPDTGNLKLAIPVDKFDPEGSIDYFARLSRSQNMPLIPVINSGNKASTFISFIQDENNVSPKITLYLAELSSVTTQEA